MNIKDIALAALIGGLTAYIGTRLDLPMDVILSCCALITIVGLYSRGEHL